MTGERDTAPSAVPRWHELSLPQPGGRAPAPGELVLVQSFINSHYDLVVEHGRDLLETPRMLASWMTERELSTGRVRLGRADVRRAIAVREGLRALASANTGAGAAPDRGAIARLNAAARGAAVEVRFAAAGPRFASATGRPLDRALGLVLAIAAAAMIDGNWSRLKACPGEDCGWAFYDHSRNQSGRWCSMAVCGGRAKARSHYRRRRMRAGERAD
jgi:predicted RNA-binding Zn ribbon-like protein